MDELCSKLRTPFFRDYVEHVRSYNKREKEARTKMVMYSPAKSFTEHY